MKSGSNTKVCKKCGYVWLSKKEKPVQCPFCKSYKWNVKGSKK